MTKETAYTRLAAIITTLAEVPGTPESSLYILCDMDLTDYEAIRNILTRAGYVTVRNHFVTITEKGRKAAAAINDAIRERPTT